MVEICRASRVSAYLSTSCRGKVDEPMVRYMMGWSEGFTLRRVGGVGICVGSLRWAVEIADCTSCAAASRLRSRSNWMVIEVEPCVFDELIELTPAMVVNWLSKGVATADAMVSGSAPGRLAFTTMVGKSTLGSSLIGSVK